MAYIRLVIALIVLTGVFIAFNPSTGMLGSGEYVDIPGGSGPPAEAVEVKGYFLVIEVISSFEFDDTQRSRPHSAALIFVDDTLRGITDETGKAILQVPSGNRSIGVTIGNQPWQAWEAFLIINRTTGIEVNFRTVAQRTSSLNLETDFLIRTTNAQADVFLDLDHDAYVEWPALLIFTTFETINHERVILPDIYRPTEWTIANNQTSRLRFDFTINEPVIFVEDAVVNLHWIEFTVT